MKITTQQLRQIIREEIQNVSTNKSKINESLSDDLQDVHHKIYTAIEKGGVTPNNQALKKAIDQLGKVAKEQMDISKDLENYTKELKSAKTADDIDETLNDLSYAYGYVI